MDLPFCEPVTEMLQEERREENKQFLKACTKNLGLLSAKQKQIWELLRKGLTPMEISVKLCMHRRQLYREFSYIKRRMMSILGEGAKP
jgi:DNA-binding NarL/FixJ family response regulator